MIVLSWPHKRRHLLNALAGLDSQVAARSDTLETSWVAQYRLHPHEPSLPADEQALQPEPVPAANPPSPAPVSAPPAPAPRSAPATRARKPDNDLVTVPDYLR